MAGLNFFDKLFDFNGDEKLGPFETGVKWGTIANIIDESNKDSGYEPCHITSMYTEAQNECDEDLSYEMDDLELAGLDRDELEIMDEDERRETLEDAGLDPDDYDF